jgi:hypothetical protein
MLHFELLLGPGRSSGRGRHRCVVLPFGIMPIQPHIERCLEWKSCNDVPTPLHIPHIESCDLFACDWGVEASFDRCLDSPVTCLRGLFEFLFEWKHEGVRLRQSIGIYLIPWRTRGQFKLASQELHVLTSIVVIHNLPGGGFRVKPYANTCLNTRIVALLLVDVWPWCIKGKPSAVAVLIRKGS